MPAPPSQRLTYLPMVISHSSCPLVQVDNLLSTIYYLLLCIGRVMDKLLLDRIDVALKSIQSRLTSRRDHN
jgi:hypothetical protein